MTIYIRLTRTRLSCEHSSQAGPGVASMTLISLWQANNMPRISSTYSTAHKRYLNLTAARIQVPEEAERLYNLLNRS